MQPAAVPSPRVMQRRENTTEKTAVNTWNSKENKPAEILSLPEGRIAADFGFLVEQSISPDNVLDAAIAVCEAELDLTVATQAKLMVLAQEHELAFQTWAPLKLM